MGDYDESSAGQDDMLAREALTRAWNWSSLHAGQGMQAADFFLISIAFLSSAYSLALTAHRPEVAAVMGVLGTVISLYFRRPGIRNRELIKAGEAALRHSQERLARVTGVCDLRILDAAEKPQQNFTSHGSVIGAPQYTVCVAFMAGAVYAVFDAVR